MKETSKTNKEIFMENYPPKETAQNPILCAEAIGYLKALIDYFPSEQNWAEIIKASLMLTLLYYTKY